MPARSIAGIQSFYMVERGDRLGPDDLAPPDYCDPIVELYKKDVDRTLLRENLKLTVEERFRKFEQFARFARELQDAGQRSRYGS